MILEASRTSRTASQGRPAGVALSALVAVALGLTLAGCHSASNSGSSSAGSPLSSWRQSPFTSQHDQMAKSVKNDPFPDANQPLRPLNANQAGNQ
jgi:hypothetical protein